MSKRGCRAVRWPRAATALLAGAALLALAACGNSNGAGGGGSGSGDSGNSSGTATTAACGTAATCTGTALTIYNSVFPAMASALSTSGGGGTIDNTGASGIPCNIAGTIDITGNYSQTPPTTYSVALFFKSCDTGTTPTTNEVVISGPVSMAGSIDTTTGYGTYNMSSPGISVNGQSYSTPVSFSCAFTMYFSYAAGPTYSFTSNVCGQSFSYP
jgi:hypothetical protein